MLQMKFPVGSCDCHLHVFGDAEHYPPIATAYAPPAAGLARIEQLHAAAGITRAVLVQPTIYGIDHRMLLAALQRRPQYRGVAIVNDQLTEADLKTLHEAGIRAARFSLGGPLGGMSAPDLERSVQRISQLGWQAKFGGTARDFVAKRDWLRTLDCTAVLDHLAGINPADGYAPEILDLVQELTGKGNWWILLANPDRRSQRAEGWDDMLPYVHAFVSAAPERAIWGSDWPHVLYGARPIPEYESLVTFLRRAVSDEATLENILVRNPARLYGFNGSQ